MKIGRHVPSLAMGALLMAGIQAAEANSILYNDFSSVAGMQLNGNAAQAGSALRLTPATYGQSGSAFSTNAVSLASNASFSSAFRFQIGNSGGICDQDGCGADGLVFTVQTVSNTAGGAGGGIGYSGLPKSIGIEFDTWNNGWWDQNDGNHVGVDLNGNIQSVVQTHVATRMNNGNVWSAWVDYDGTSNLLEVRLAEGAAASRPSSALLSYTADLATVLGSPNAYVGFTSGTGSAFGDHDILAWQFNSTYAPISTVGGGSVPEPSTLALMAFAAVGVGFGRRRAGRTRG